jgi:NTE family protein
MSKNGLVLTGGGARSAYQVGVLKGIADITGFKTNPFPVISGVSAGAINGVWLASHFGRFDAVTQQMWDAWAALESEKIFKTDPATLMGIASRWVKDLGSGGNLGSQITYLLDSSPLKNFVKKNIAFENLHKHIQSGELHGVCVSATNYLSGYSTSFFDGSEQIKHWKRQNRLSFRTNLSTDHVMASAAIPVFFPPVLIHGNYYGDGMIRLNAPLSPAIHLGADKLFVIGVHALNPMSTPEKAPPRKITLGDIAGTILNGLFFDSLDADLERMNRVNQSLNTLQVEQIHLSESALREIPVLTIRPSRDIKQMASGAPAEWPLTLRYLFKGIGVHKERGLDLVSYLTFERTYIQSLLVLGYEDAMAQREHILDFFDK